MISTTDIKRKIESKFDKMIHIMTSDENDTKPVLRIRLRKSDDD